MAAALKFRKAYLEITNTCNLACDFCPGTTRATEYITPSRAERYIALLAPISGILHLHVMGEPLQHPEFGAILASCAEHGAKVNLVTNGTLLSRHATRLLDSSAVHQISVSLHSLEANAGQDTSFYIAQLIAFISSPKKRPIISLRLWNRGQSLNSKATGTFLTALCTSGIYEGTPAEIVQYLQGKGTLKIADTLFINTAKRFEWPDLTGPDLGAAGHCAGLRNQIAVLVDGTVTPCCLDRNGVTALGNLETQTLEEIMATPRARAMREGLLQRRLTEPLCRRCSYRQRFNTPHKGKQPHECTNLD